jgi:putative glutamine amidotransferase
VGEGLTVMAYAADGTIEGVADTTDRWWMGVQWHPERTPDDAATQALFREFVSRASTRMENRTEAKV